MKLPRFTGCFGVLVTLICAPNTEAGAIASGNANVSCEPAGGVAITDSLIGQGLIDCSAPAIFHGPDGDFPVWLTAVAEISWTDAGFRAYGATQNYTTPVGEARLELLLNWEIDFLITGGTGPGVLTTRALLDQFEGGCLVLSGGNCAAIPFVYGEQSTMRFRVTFLLGGEGPRSNIADISVEEFLVEGNPNAAITIIPEPTAAVSLAAAFAAIGLCRRCGRGVFRRAGG